MKFIKKINIMFVLAFLASAVAAWGAYTYLLSVKETYRLEGNFKNVVVAAKDIKARTVINATDVVLKEIPKNLIHPNAIKNIEEVSGKVASSYICAGEQLLQQRLIDSKKECGDLALKVEKGQRAVTIPSNEVTGLSNMLSPGDRVDIFVTFDTEGNAKQSMTTLIIQNAAVIATGHSLEEEIKETKETAKESTLTLAVPAIEAQSLIMAVQRGSLQLALRNPGDNQVSTTHSINLNSLVR